MLSTKVRYVPFSPGRFFGVELEVDESVSRTVMADVVRRADTSRHVVATGWTLTGVAGMPYDVPRDSWNVKTDRTCATRSGNLGHEVVSPKLFSADDIRTCGNVTERLKEARCRLNDNCGFHVHADVSNWTIEGAGIMLAHWVRCEKVISQMLPVHRRKNAYSQFYSEKFPGISRAGYDAEGLYRAVAPVDLGYHQNRCKRVAVNLVGFATGLINPDFGRRTAELRLPEGTLEREDVENWVRFHVHFLNVCESRKMITDLSPASLSETVEILGWAGKDEFFLLSPELLSTKVWFLRRILKYTTDATLFREAVEMLNKTVEPLEKYVEEVKEIAA